MPTLEGGVDPDDVFSKVPYEKVSRFWCISSTWRAAGATRTRTPRTARRRSRRSFGALLERSKFGCVTLEGFRASYAEAFPEGERKGGLGHVAHRAGDAPRGRRRVLRRHERRSGRRSWLGSGTSATFWEWGPRTDPGRGEERRRGVRLRRAWTTSCSHSWSTAAGRTRCRSRS